MTKTILGLDPGTARTGYGIVERDGNAIHMIAHGLIETTAGMEQATRLQQIFMDLKKLLEEYRPDSVAIEKLYFQTNVKTAMSVSEARGVLLLAVAESNVPLAEYTALQVKQAVAGYGKADKTQVATMVCRQLALRSAPRPDDITDALAIALCHAFWRAT